jgi:hypothetical protein
MPPSLPQSNSSSVVRSVIFEYSVLLSTNAGWNAAEWKFQTEDEFDYDSGHLLNAPLAPPIELELELVLELGLVLGGKSV